MVADSRSDAQLFIAQVKQRYPTSSTTFRDFKRLLLSNPTDQNDVNGLLSDVRDIFSRDIYLIHEFKRFLPAKTQSKLAVRKRNSKDQKQCINDCREFINAVHAAVRDRAVFLSIIEMFMDYKKHDRPAVRGVRREALFGDSGLLREYPLLQKKLTAILGENVDKMYDTDLSFHRMLSAKKAAERLIAENAGGSREKQTAERMREEIDVWNYFSALDRRCVKDELKGYAVLPDRLMSRGMAVEHSMEILSLLDNMIRDSAAGRYTDEELEAMADREKEVQILEWDWHSHLSDDMYRNNPVQLCSESSSKIE